MLYLYNNNNGDIIFTIQDNGLIKNVNTLFTDIPNGYYLEKIDTSLNPHQPIFKKIPKSKMELMEERIMELEAQNAALIEGINTVVKQEV